MPNITTYLTIGTVEPGGDFVPSHWAYLVEHGRPTWFIALAPVHWVNLGVEPSPTWSLDHVGSPEGKSTWLTTPTRVLPDAIVMVATVVEKIPSVIEAVDGATELEGEVINLAKLPAPMRQKLDELNRTAKHTVHIVATVLANSVFAEQMNLLPKYPISIQVCTPEYTQDGSSLGIKDNRPSDVNRDGLE